MTDQSRKRQKVSNKKTKEENELESDLFGSLELDDASDDEQLRLEGLSSVLDEHLFFVDESGKTAETAEDTEDDDDDEAPTVESTRRPATSAVWTDSAHPTEIVSLNSQTRKLRQSANESSLQFDEYERRLRDKYVSLNSGAVSWADKARKRLRDPQAAEAEDAAFLNSTEGILRRKEKQKGIIDSGFLNIQRLRDPNLTVSKLKEGGNGGNGEIKSLAFHPSPKIPILCVASADRRVRLFNTSSPNPTDPLTTLHVPHFPVQSPGPLFVPPFGSSVLLTSQNRPYWWIWDLDHGAISRKDINFNSYSDLSATLDHRNRNSRKRMRIRHGGSTLNPTFSPSGSILACSSNNNNVFLVDWARSKTGVVGSFKCSGPTGSIIKSLHFVPKSFAPSSLPISSNVNPSQDQNLAVLTSTGLVYIYDVAFPSRPVCVRKWGGASSGAGWKSSTTSSAFSAPAGLFAVGTNSGYVDMYSASSVFSTFEEEEEQGAEQSQLQQQQQPKPIKSISNIRTSISSLDFSHDGKLLSVASQEGGKTGWRVMHTQTLTTYTNFPPPNNPPMKGGVTSFAFSPTDELLTVGDTRGRVGMWRINASAS